MKNIFRVPVDNQHFKDTIEVGKPFNEVANFLSGEYRARLERITKDGVVRFWGSTPGEANKRNFQKLSEGDELLCYRSGNYIALCKIAFTTINRELAKYAWGETQTGTTWELIYFFSEVRTFKIDSSIINKEFGFAEGPVMGFSPVNANRTKQFLAKHNSVENFINELGYEEKLQSKISEEISKLKIQSPFEAQFYLVDLGNQLQFDTYVPSSDAGHEVFGKKLAELTTIKKDDLSLYFGPAIFSPLSTIDVIWFKSNYTPKYFYEVIHRTGWSEALLRLDTVSKHFDSANARIVGPEESRQEFADALRKWSGPRDNLNFKCYEQLINVHSESLHFQKIVDEFLA